jgi:hypothetical protein
MIKALDLALLHFSVLQLAKYVVVESGLTVMVEPVWPFDHVTVPAQPVAERTKLSPWQIVVLLQAITGAANWLTVTFTASDFALSHLPIWQMAV